MAQSQMQTQPARKTAEEREAEREAFNATIPRTGGASDPDAKLDDGSIPPGGGSTPDPNDPATLDPLGHLDDLPGVTEEPPSPGEGLPDAPAPEPPPSPSPPAVERVRARREE